MALGKRFRSLPASPATDPSVVLLYQSSYRWAGCRHCCLLLQNSGPRKARHRYTQREVVADGSDRRDSDDRLDRSIYSGTTIWRSNTYLEKQLSDRATCWLRGNRCGFRGMGIVPERTRYDCSATGKSQPHPKCALQYPDIEIG